MNFHQTIRKAALLGMKQEPEDIIDYIVIRASLLVSVLMGAALAIWVGRAGGPWEGALVGIGSYAVSMRLGALMFFPRRHPR